MKKRGFTLIEIIISISLIAIIGTISVVSIISLRKAKVENLLESNSKVLNNALEVYLEKHPEVTNNVNKNFKGAVVTLQVLKDEGLIDIKGLSNDAYKDNYYLLSNSILADGSTAVSDANKECANNILSVQTVSSWDLKNLDKSKIIYICPKSSDSNNYQDILNAKNYIFKGDDPKNYVKLDVKSENENKSWSWWPSGIYQNLWRIISFDKDGRIKLVYSTVVGTINVYNYHEFPGLSEKACRKITDITDGKIRSAHKIEEINDAYYNLYYCNINASYNCYGIESNSYYYFQYDKKDIWTSSEVISEYSEYNLEQKPNECYPKKTSLLNNINETIRNQIISTKYGKAIFEDNTTKDLAMKLGFLTEADYNDTIDNNGKTWIDKDNIWEDIPVYYKASFVINVIEEMENKTREYTLFQIKGHTYQPVITLSRNVKLKYNSDDKCSGKDGTFECPYELKVE